MSLINDALKKAQKLQLQGQTPPPPNPGGAPSVPSVPDASGAPSRPASSGRDRSMPGQLFMLLAFGAGALIAVSVLVTVYLLRSPAAPSPPVAAAPVMPEKPAPAPIAKAPPPALSLPNGPAPASEKFPPTNPAPAVTVTPPEPAFMPPPPPSALSQPVVSLSNPSNGLDPSKPDPKILAYLDALQIAGIRVSGTGSKVLMNDRVFRENEIVDHLLGLRLKKVENDTLTFVDERGVVYTKSF